MKINAFANLAIALAAPLILISCHQSPPASSRTGEEANGGSEISDKRVAAPPLIIEPNIRGNLQVSLDERQRVETTLASTDIDEALKVAMKQSDPSLRIKAVLQIALEACRSDLNQLPDILRQVKDGEVRGAVANSLAAKWALKDPKYSFEFANKNLAGVEKNLFMQRAGARVIGNGDFNTASDFVTTMPFSSARSDVIFRLANSWAKKDKMAAYSWAKTLPLAEDKKSALGELIISSSKTDDMNLLTNLINENADSELRIEGLAKIVEILSTVGQPVEAFDWVERLPHDLKPQAQAQIIKSMGSADPEKWTAYALTINDANARHAAIYNLAGKIFTQSPAEATQWVNKLPESVKESAINSIVNKWFDTDSEALSDWINKLPVGTSRDASLRALVDCLSHSDISAARDAASGIGDKTLKANVIAKLNRQK